MKTVGAAVALPHRKNGMAVQLPPQQRGRESQKRNAVCRLAAAGTAAWICEKRQDRRTVGR
jgi:hypothetical protein